MNWISESVKRSKVLKDHYKLYDIDVYIKDRLPEHIDVDFVLKYISTLLPGYILKKIDIIYVGEFPEILDKNHFTALYKDGAIYISNKQHDEHDMIEDFIHEIAHSIEHLFDELVYADGKIIREFLGKRQKLYYFLKANNLNPPDTIQTNANFDHKIDDYFYNKVGYAKLASLVAGLFLSPYSCTSVREYFATGLQEYVQGDKKYLKKTCPSLFIKLENIFNLEY